MKSDLVTIIRSVPWPCTRLGKETLRGRKTKAVEQVVIKNSITIYPNPAKSIMNISCNNNSIKQVEIIDILGKTVLTKMYSNTNKAQINIEGLQKGVALVKITSSNNIITTQKLIIE